MQIQTIFKAGNSEVVAIPKHLLRETGMKAGQKVMVEKTSEGDSFLIRKVSKKKIKEADSPLDEEFRTWLEVFLKENKEILDELAIR